jgi:hypothetical protein
MRFSNPVIGSSNRYTLRLDDVHVCDTSGSHNNGFLGDVRVVTLRPDADTAQAGFTPASAGAHHTQVDDAPDHHGDATYLESDTVGHQERLGYQDLTSTPAAILALQLATVARKDDAGSRSLRAVLKSGSTTATGAIRALATGYTLYDDVFETDTRRRVPRGRRRRWMRLRRGGGGVTTARLGQRAAEVLLQPEQRAPARQQAGEVLLLPAAWARICQQPVEVLRTVAGTCGPTARKPVGHLENLPRADLSRCFISTWMGAN